MIVSLVIRDPIANGCYPSNSLFVRRLFVQQINNIGEVRLRE